VGGIPLNVFIQSQGIDPEIIRSVMEDAKKGGTHFVNETGQSASAGPAKAVGQMLQCVVSGHPEVQPVVAIIENEYGLLKEDDQLDSMSFGVPARIGSHGVEVVYELPVDDIREALETSAGIVKEDIRQAAAILKERNKGE